MLRYTAARILWTIPTLLVVMTLLFFMLRAIGGSPFRHGPFLGLTSAVWVKYGDPQPGAISTNMTRKYGLDRPWWRQYLYYLEGIGRLDLGPSFTFKDRTVNEIVREQGRSRSSSAASPSSGRSRSGCPSGCSARCGRTRGST